MASSSSNNSRAKSERENESIDKSTTSLKESCAGVKVAVACISVDAKNVIGNIIDGGRVIGDWRRY